MFLLQLFPWVVPLMTSLVLLQTLHHRGSSGCTVSGILGSSLGLPGFWQGAQVPAREVSLRCSFLSLAFRRASPPGVSKYEHFSPSLRVPSPGRILTPFQSGQNSKHIFFKKDNISCRNIIFLLIGLIYVLLMGHWRW